jgi:hypothetical protein
MRHMLFAWVAAAVTAVAVLAAAGPAAASIPANPAFQSSARFGAWHNGGFIIFNNAWNGSAGPQTVWAHSFHNWGAESTQQAGNTAVETYPSVQKNFNNVPVSSFRLIQNGFTESMPANRNGLDAEAADDVWLNNFNIEVMIWVDNHGQRPAGSVIGHATILGQHFAVWHTGSIFSFVLDHNETSGRTHMLASLRWLMNHGLISRSVTLTQVDFGWEIASTGGQPRDFVMPKYWLHTRRV